MTEQDLIAYLEAAILPETLRLDRATTQLDVKEAVKRNIEQMMSDAKDGNAKHRLTQIWYALENPYNGPEIPRF